MWVLYFCFDVVKHFKTCKIVFKELFMFNSVTVTVLHIEEWPYKQDTMVVQLKAINRCLVWVQSKTSWQARRQAKPGTGKRTREWGKIGGWGDQLTGSGGNTVGTATKQVSEITGDVKKKFFHTLHWWSDYHDVSKIIQFCHLIIVSCWCP